MKSRIMYIEKKTDGIKFLDDKGPHEIKEVTFSRTGKTIYCENKTYQRQNGIYGNYYCLENDSEYWISGVKKTGSNRLNKR